MSAKIDIKYTLKVLKKSRTSEAENQQKIKKSQSLQKIHQF